MDKKSKPEKGKASLNRDVAVFAFFLLLSFLFWYLNSLSKVSEATIKFNAEYTSLPKGRFISEDTTAPLSVSIKGSGYSLLKIRLSEKNTPLYIDLSKVTYRRVPGSKNSEYFIITSSLLKPFSSQIRSGCEVIAIRPDTLFLNFDRQVIRK